LPPVSWIEVHRCPWNNFNQHMCIDVFGHHFVISFLNRDAQMSLE
jgi:hypothetical protein